MDLSYAQQLGLKIIEITTGLNHGSKQSMKYLEQAEKELSNECCIIPSTDFNGKCFRCNKQILIKE